MPKRCDAICERVEAGGAPAREVDRHGAGLQNSRSDLYGVGLVGLQAALRQGSHLPRLQSHALLHCLQHAALQLRGGAELQGGVGPGGGGVFPPPRRALRGRAPPRVDHDAVDPPQQPRRVRAPRHGVRRPPRRQDAGRLHARLLPHLPAVQEGDGVRRGEPARGARPPGAQVHAHLRLLCGGEGLDELPRPARHVRHRRERHGRGAPSPGLRRGRFPRVPRGGGD
mmetsp:Transcript_13111/g.27991  ORF Transcript_13111/g.27991 Transcript_13111/m.27991 type:complete len:226 (-) Transcript_13111:381-1058(-)